MAKDEYVYFIDNKVQHAGDGDKQKHIPIETHPHLPELSCSSQ